MGIAREFGRHIAPKAAHAAPGLTSRAVLEALDRAIDGVGPLPGAAQAAQKQLDEQNGDVEKAVREVIENNVALAGAQGFVTNIGGIAVAAVTLPANVIGLAVLQCRLIAGIAHLRGHDITSPAVRNAILATMIGDDEVSDLVKSKKLPGPPSMIALQDEVPPTQRAEIATEVGASLIAKVAGKRLVTFAGRRIPVVGGVVGAGADGFGTWMVGRYASKQFTPRKGSTIKGDVVS